MTAKHTPGPWATYFCNPGERNGVIYSESLSEFSANICELVADTCIKDNDRRRGDKWVFSEQRAADARLIAAAPDLLWALEKMLREHDALQMAENKTDDRWPAATYARATIAKARGE